MGGDSTARRQDTEDRDMVAMGASPKMDRPALDPLQLLGLMRARRSSRSGYLEDRPVSDEQIDLLLEAARAAPSAGNAQPWEFIVVRDRDIRNRIAELFKRQLQDKMELERTIRGHAKVGGSIGWRLAPVLILCLGDPRTSASFPLRTQEDKAESHFYSSLANALLQMMLMAECLGLGTQYISDVSSPYFSLMLKHLLGIPRELKVYHLMPVGYVSVRPQPSSRRPLQAMVHYDRYDPGRQRTAEDIERFIQQDSIQSKGYQWGGAETILPEKPR